MPSDSARAACIAKSAFVLSGSLPALRRTTQTKTMTTQPISTDLSVYGYARVSTTDQSLDIQIAALKVAGCEKIRSEKVATSTNGRQELKTLLEFIDAGDVLIVTRIDRLARSIGDLQDIVRALKAKGVALRATEQPIDTARPPARHSSTCSACSQSSRPTCVKSDRWKGSQRPRLLASTRAVHRPLIKPRS